MILKIGSTFTHKGTLYTVLSVNTHNHDRYHKENLHYYVTYKNGGTIIFHKDIKFSKLERALT